MGILKGILDMAKAKKKVAKKTEAMARTLDVVGARHNNLKDIEVKFPLETLTVVTGPSGCGKSSLVNDILFKALSRRLHRSTQAPGAHKGIRGIENVNKVLSPTNLKLLKKFDLYPKPVEFPVLHWQDESKYTADSLTIALSKGFESQFFSLDKQSVLIYLNHAPKVIDTISVQISRDINQIVSKYDFEEVHLGGRVVGQTVYIDLIKDETIIFIGIYKNFIIRKGNAKNSYAIQFLKLTMDKSFSNTVFGGGIRIKGSKATIEGNTNFIGAEVMSSDLRASAALVLAAIRSCKSPSGSS